MSDYQEYLHQEENIIVKGARAHNLKNINVTIPRESLTVITGPSGSGKSSLAFDTLYAEGQRRYVESLSVYARQFLDRLTKPDVDLIQGLSPTISIEQRTTSYNPRSTVGTVTEIYDYFRLLFARIGKPFCWSCNRPITSQSQQQICDQIGTYEEGSKLAILSPIIRGRKGEHRNELIQLRQRGFVRVRVDGAIHDLTDEIQMDRNKKHDVEVYVDRLVIKGDRGILQARIAESVELALKLGGGFLILQELGKKETKDILMSEKFACTYCNINYPEPEPRTFSFNSPAGACGYCDGLGYDPQSDTEENLDSSDGEFHPEEIKNLLPCPECKGDRLKIEALHFRIGSQNIAQWCSHSITALYEMLLGLKLPERDALIADKILKEIQSRVHFLQRVGVGYLNLNRTAQTLSGGESQRIRLATQIGSSLVDVVYILDEPSIGLHPRDHQKLLNTLVDLKNLGNTVLVVEHDRETIESADYILDLGPGAGIQGGEVVAAGTIDEIRSSPNSLTGQYLSQKKSIEIPAKRRPIDHQRVLRIIGAKKNNLKNLTVDFPLGVFICVTGVSGSGKSTLVIDSLYRSLLSHVYKVDAGDTQIKKIEGLENIDKVIDIDQSPIGKTPRSNPATYTGIFSLIRDLFSQLPDSQMRGYKPGRYSFNVKGGRCEACEGDGVKRIVMHFLPDVFVECDVCQGKRYNRETLEIRYKGKNIADVLDMPCEQALGFFDAIPAIHHRLKILNEVGLGYVCLGQSSTTLSGGEAQRIKLARELSKRSTGKTFYILDEPTTGLHFDDVQKLISILQALVDQGNTVLVIEHNLDLIKIADHIIDLGPEGGVGGGRILASGTPELVSQAKESYTGQFLKSYLI